MAEENKSPEVGEQTEERNRVQDRQEEDWQPGETLPAEQERMDADVSGLAELFQDLPFPAGKAEVLQRVPMGRTFHLRGPGDQWTKAELNRLVVEMGRNRFASEHELLDAIREAVRKELHPELAPPLNPG